MEKVIKISYVISFVFSAIHRHMKCLQDVKNTRQLYFQYSLLQMGKKAGTIPWQLPAKSSLEGTKALWLKGRKREITGFGVGLA